MSAPSWSLPTRMRPRAARGAIHFGHVSLIAIAAALTLSAAPAFADGGKGGMGAGGTLIEGGGLGGNGGGDGQSGRNGEDFFNNSGGGGGGGGGSGGGVGGTGGEGGPGLGGAPPFGGGPGLDGTPGNDQSSGGGGGGNGGANGGTSDGPFTVSAPTAGENGEAGGAGGSSDGGGGGGGGGGGAGGIGFLETGAASVTNTATITGGTGGIGGNGGDGYRKINDYGGYGGDGGNGGDGGTGFSASAAGAKLTNTGTIQGGAGGEAGSGGTTATGAGSDNGHDGAGGSGGAGVVGAGLRVIDSGTIAGGLSSGGTQANAITFTGGANTLTLQQGWSLTGDIGVTGSLTFDQAIAVTLSNAITGTGSVIQAGPGTLALTGVNTYAGGTTIDAGTLQIGDGGTNGSITGAVVDNAALTFNRSDAMTYGGVITGSGSVTQAGPGTLTLTGTNTYTGGTTLDAGTLAVSADANLGRSTGGLSFAGGTLQLLTGFSTGRAITLATGGGTIDTGTNTATLSSAIAGAGGLTKEGTGVLIVSGIDNYRGATQVNAGTLRAGAADAFSAASAYTLAAGATLDLAEPQADDRLAHRRRCSDAGRCDADGRRRQLQQDLLRGHRRRRRPDQARHRHADAFRRQQLLLRRHHGCRRCAGGRRVAQRLGRQPDAGRRARRPRPGRRDLGRRRRDRRPRPGDTLHHAWRRRRCPLRRRLDLRGRHCPRRPQRPPAVAGTATLAGGTVVVAPAPGAYTPASRYTFLTAAGGLSGSFASLSTPADFSQAFAFLTPTLSYDAGGVVLGFAQTTDFAAAAATANQAATASALQVLGLGNPLYDAVVGQSFGGARQAFDALSGEVHAGVLTAAFEDSRLVREAVLDRLSRASAPLTGPGSEFTTAGIAGGGTDGLALTAGHDADLPGRQKFGPPSGAAAGLWARVLGDAGTSRGDGNAATLSRDSGGLILGGDLGGIAFAGGSLRLGAAAGALHDSLAVDARGASGHLDQLFGALYGGASFGAVELSAGAAYGSMSTGIDRRIAFPGFDEAASSDRHGWTAQAFGEAGYRFDLSGRDLGPAALEAAFWQPILGAALIRLHQDDFGAAGGPAALTGLAGSQDLATTTLGVRAAATLAGHPAARDPWPRRPGVMRYGDIVPTAALAFQGGQPFSVAGVPVDRDALVAEAGLALPLGCQSSLGLSYSGQFGKTAADHAISATVTVGF